MIATLFLLAASPAMTFTADRVAADHVTQALAATGHIKAVIKPMTLRGEYMTREEDGTATFHDPTCATTCSNDVGHTHWNVTGELRYKAEDSVVLRNAWLRFYEIPVLWLPYFYYPLDPSCGFSWMPGYSHRWGAYLLTKYSYHLLGSREHEEGRWSLSGDTRLDLRYEQGIALGEDLSWRLGDFGAGKLKVYYAWDRSDDYGSDGLYDGRWYYKNWGSSVPDERYAVELSHRWEPTERDVVRVKGSVFSDSYMREDFFRESFFGFKNQWLSHEGNEVSWEHLERAFATGVGVSGPLNDFYGGTCRLPEVFFDVAPLPVFGLPVNYETENRIGYLGRRYAEYGDGVSDNPFAHNPGPWADYEAFRFDTYHRLTAPFRTLDDVLAVAPRVGYHGTFWNESGEDNLTGWGSAVDAGSLFRSILEGGMTFSARGTGWIDERWRHMVEPYADILAQEAWFSGNGNRPYVFDSLDASVMWEDQFAGRSRNLPYSYYGITPGLRNAWQRQNEKGALRTVVDFDVYAALQFRHADWLSDASVDPDRHKLAEPGSPNYGKSDCYVMPGARVKFTPADDTALMSDVQYDSDSGRIAFADATFSQKVSADFRYYATYSLRDFRWWDFSSSPYNPSYMTSDGMNRIKFHYVQLGFEQHPLDWFAWSPFVRWDIKEGELDTVGSWIDYLTDCLGFRLLLEYQNKFTRIDGRSHEEDFSVGFFIYLRAFGADSANVFKR